MLKRIALSTLFVLANAAALPPGNCEDRAINEPQPTARFYRGTPLKDIAAEFNRLHPDTIIFDFKKNTGEKLFNGTINNLSDIERVIEVFRSYEELDVERRGNVVIVKPRWRF